MSKKQIIILSIVAIAVSVFLIYGYNNFGWFGGKNKINRQAGGCQTDADCPAKGTHCGSEGICVYDLAPRNTYFKPYFIRTTPSYNPPPRPIGAIG